MRAKEEERLEKSWVVEGPITGIPRRSEFGSLRGFERKVRQETNLGKFCVQKLCRCMEALVVF